MRNLRQIFKSNRTSWSLVGGLLLAGLLGGCSTPFIDISVQVDSCPSGSTTGDTRIPILPRGAGTCFAGVPHTGQIPSGTMCKNTTGQIINCPANAQCSSGSKKCPNPPGTCGRTATPCRTTWTQSTSGSTSGTCICGGC